MEINRLNKGASSKTDSGQTTAASSAASKEAASNTRQTAAAPRQDTVVLSSEAQALSRLQKQVDSSTPVNREKVDALKAAIAKGEYQPNPQRIADKMLNSENLF